MIEKFPRRWKCDQIDAPLRSRRIRRTVCAIVPFSSRALHRARRLSREDRPKDWFRLASGPRGAAALLRAWLTLQRGHQRRDGEGGRAALHPWTSTLLGRQRARAGARLKGTLHWVSAAHCPHQTEVRLYDRLFQCGSSRHHRGTLASLECSSIPYSLERLSDALCWSPHLGELAPGLALAVRACWAISGVFTNPVEARLSIAP